MNIKEDRRKKFAKNLLWIVIFLVCIFFILKVSIITEITSLLLASFILAYSLKPIQNALIKRGVTRRTSSLLLVLGLILCIVIMFTILIPSIVRESSNIKSTLEEMGRYFQNLYYKLKPEGNNKIIYTIFNTINNKIRASFLQMFNKIIEFGAQFSENILSYFVIPIITYYFLCDNKYLKSKMLTLFPLSSRCIIKKINKDVDRILGRYIITQFMLSIFISILTFVVLFFLKVKFPLMLAILNGVLNIIPYFGPIFGALPCIIVAFLTSNKVALYTALWLYLIQLVEGNIISPKVIGESVSIHPVCVIIILLIGEKVGGLLGMILAVPISVIIKVIYEDLNYYLF
ncbi:AI-2E family transporter [Clostridium sp. MB40-C1]|uniref:AI-2E family transporter n=1 Tax=Clostridium sp. MB40-C1 TaxID=3070996 RepID=UPI0027E11087|nr:AI-2E family transporter [Clostridium sp. MB40-C1]WMJ82138.1 AI-2E family transporter [Clostridium sp. MB40-C1]